jgi:hypothetical protein
MQEVAHFVEARTQSISGSMTLLNNFWHGVGGWIA